MPDYRFRENPAKLTAVRANCGIGKTVGLITEFEREDYLKSSILLIAPQRSLTRSLLASFSRLGFVSYQDIAGEINPAKYPKLIVTPESLHRLQNTDYALCVLEEVALLLKCFRSKTMVESRRCHAIFKGLLRRKPVVAIDATMDDALIGNLQQLIKTTEEETRIIHNTYVRERRKVRFTVDRTDFMGTLVSSLQEGNKVGICTSCGAERALALHNELAARGYNGLVFTGRMAEGEKQRAFADLDGVLERSEAQYVIMTPVVTSGVSIKRVAFDEVFCDFSLGARIDCRAAFQMAHRIRQIRMGRVTILVDLRQEYRPTGEKGLLHYLESIHRTADEHAPFAAHCDTEICPDGSHRYEPSFSLTLHLYLLAEENRSRNDFLGGLAGLYEGAGYDIETLGAPIATRTQGQTIAKTVRTGTQNLKKARATSTANAAIVDAETAHHIRQKQADPSATESIKDTAKLRKYDIATFYGVEPEKITPEFVQRNDNEKARQQHRAREYARLTLDELKAKHRERIGRSVVAATTYAPLIPKVIVLEEILRGIGFENGFWTEKTLWREELEVSIIPYVDQYKKCEQQIYKVLNKKWKRHKSYDLDYYIRFLEPVLQELYGAQFTKVHITRSRKLQSLAIVQPSLQT